AAAKTGSVPFVSTFAYLQTGSGCRGKCLEPSDRIKPGVFDEACISLFSLSHREAGSRSSANGMATTGRRRSLPSALSSLSREPDRKWGIRGERAERRPRLGVRIECPCGISHRHERVLQRNKI